MKNFNSKETYLAARAEWKAEYAELSQQIRDARKAYNQAQTVFSKTPIRDNHAGYWAAHKAVQTARDYRETLRNEASTMISELFNMKQEAAAQWEAARALA